jgi:hypothetical protein
MSKKLAATVDPHALACVIVDRLHDDLSMVLGVDVEDLTIANDSPWGRLVASVTPAPPEVTDAVWRQLEADVPGAEDRELPATLAKMLDGHARAGYLVGLEVGRRLGGAR